MRLYIRHSFSILSQRAPTQLLKFQSYGRAIPKFLQPPFLLRLRSKEEALQARSQESQSTIGRASTKISNQARNHWRSSGIYAYTQSESTTFYANRMLHRSTQKQN